MTRYVLGVDGGNSKTDYLLCTLEGQYVDILRCPTCSHEQLADSYEGTLRLMREQVSVLLKRNQLSISDICAGAFGLAGADLPEQIDKLKICVEGLGVRKYAVANDSVLGIKALSESGSGVCAINGTGTVVTGVDYTGRTVQIGGIGTICGDKAGGGYILRAAIGAVYDHFYRCAPYSVIVPEIMDILQISSKEQYMSRVHNYNTLLGCMVDIIKCVDRAAAEGERVACEILDDVGTSLGNSIAGCIQQLAFKGQVDVVLGGSLWYKIAYSGMMDFMRKRAAANTDIKCNFMVLYAPPAIGGALWAIELASGSVVNPCVRQQLLSCLTIEKYEEIVGNSQ